MPIRLTAKQEVLRQNLEAYVNTLRNHFDSSAKLEGSQVQEIYRQMGRVAHELHMSLDPPPTHHAYMIENRGMLATDPKFYEHFHPCEDLLAYLQDPTTNDDPMDHTLGDEFIFRVWTRRWGHYDTYHLTCNMEGWYVRFTTGVGQGNRGGEPALQHALTHDSVSFPRTLDVKMMTIWEQAKNLGLTHDQVQDVLNQVAEWVSDTERNEPHTGIFQY